MSTVIETLAPAGTWNADPVHSDVSFEVVSVPLTEATAELKLVPASWYETAKTFFG